MEDNIQGSVEKLMDQFGFYMTDQRNHQKAKEILDKVMEILTKEFGETDLDVAMTHNYFGNVLTEEGKYEEALEKHHTALQIQLKILGANHFETAFTYNLLGIVFERQGENKKAEEMFRKVLEIKLETLPKDHPELTYHYQTLVGPMQRQGKIKEAIKIQKRILVSKLQMHGEDHPDVVTAYTGVAGLLAKQNRLEDAIRMLDKCIEISIRLLHRGDIDKGRLATAIRNKAKMLEELGNFEGAKEELMKILKIQKESVGEIHVTVAQTYEELATLYAEQKMVEESIDALTKAIHIHRSMLGNDHPRVIELVGQQTLLMSLKTTKNLTEQAVAMNAQGPSEKGEKVFLEALKSYKSTFSDYPKTAALWETISALKAEQGLLQEAVDASAEAVKVRRRSFGDDHADTKARIEAHKALLRRLLANRS